MDENKVITEEETKELLSEMEADDEEVEETSGGAGYAVAGVALVSLAGFGVYSLIRKGINAYKAHKEKKATSSEQGSKKDEVIDVEFKEDTKEN